MLSRLLILKAIIHSFFHPHSVVASYNEWRKIIAG